MRIPSPLLWFKAQIGSTAAKVELSVRSPSNGRFDTALIAIQNREARLTQAWRRDQVSETQLVDRSRYLTDLRQKLYQNPSPMAHSQSMQDMLTRICNPSQAAGPRSFSGSLESLASRTSVSSRTSVASSEQFQGRALAALADAVWSGQLNSLKELRTEVLATADLIADADPTRRQSEVVAEVFDGLQARAPVGSGLAGPEWSVVRYLRREMLTNSDGPGGRVATDRLVVDADNADRFASWLAQPLPAGPAPPKPPRLGQPRAISLARDWRPGESSA
ncbi:hypothetical protein J7J08_11070 [Stenotrophomonas sp. ISL-67]|uniref:hypothetical protein n=1 Tax=Stenotrophomonas sp. ISL-67 TaxID=2819171 RepID=UPI001BEA5362|nr:hypothetical protein [Stenotrophomonas sp. ISL-67]MBT2768179.1 hypothetical protein [Stenotrophomonas sp. ISL-67]